MRNASDPMLYPRLKNVGDQLCGVSVFAFTFGLVVGIDECGYERRYCYEHYEDASNALAGWDGVDHPSGPWIKCKGRYKGVSVDMINPQFGVSRD